MMINLMVEEEKKSSDLTEAEVVADAHSLAYDALIKAQEANRALVRLKDLRARLSKPNSTMSQAAPLLEPALEYVALSPADQSRTSVEEVASPTVGDALAYDALFKAQEAKRALVRLKDMRARLSKPNFTVSQAAPLLEPALEYVALSPADHSRTSFEGVASPTVGGDPSFISLPLKELRLEPQRPEIDALSPAEQSGTSVEGTASPTMEIAPYFPSIPKSESILKKTSTSSPKAVRFVRSGHYNYAPPEALFPDPFAGPEGLWGDYDVDVLCGVAPPYEDEQEYFMHQPNRSEAQAVPAPNSPKEDSIVAEETVVAPAVETVAAVGVAVLPEQSFPDPFRGNHDEPCGDVDVDILCGLLSADDEDLHMEQIEQVLTRPSEDPTQLEASKEESPATEETAVTSPIESTHTQPSEEPTQLEASKEESPVAEETAVTSPVESTHAQPSEEPTKLEAPKEDASPVAEETVESTYTQPSEEPTKLEAPKEESPVAEITIVTSPVESIAVAVAEDTFSFDRLCGVTHDQVEPLTITQPNQIQAQQQQPTCPLASPTAAEPVEEPVTPVVEPMKPVSPKEEPTVAAVGVAPHPEQPFPSGVVAVAEDPFFFDRLCCVADDHVGPLITTQHNQIQAQQQQPTCPVASPTAAEPVEEPVTPIVEPMKPVSPKEEPAVGVAVHPEQPFPGGVVAVAEDPFFFDRLCCVADDQVEPLIPTQHNQIQAQQQQPTCPVASPTATDAVEAAKEEPTVDTKTTVTPAVTAEVTKIQAPKEESTVDTESPVTPAVTAEVTKIQAPKEEFTDNTVTPAEAAEVKPLEAAAAPTPEAPKEESAIAQKASAKAADLASEGQEKTEGVYEEQNRIQEDPKASPAPKQEEAKPEEHLQLEVQEQMIQANAAKACGCSFF
jgi:hypothetical protein